MPMERSSFTECWVGLVFNSPALGIQGMSVMAYSELPENRNLRITATVGGEPAMPRASAS